MNFMRVSVVAIGFAYMFVGVAGIALSAAFTIIIRSYLVNYSMGGRSMTSTTTIHGVAMIFLGAMPLLASMISNINFGLIIGEVPLPATNIGSLLVYLAGAAIITATIAGRINGNSLNLGWTIYPPLSSSTAAGSINATLVLAGLLVLGMSSTLGAMNSLLVSIELGSNLMALIMGVVGGLLLIALPVLAGGLILLIISSVFSSTFTTTGRSSLSLFYQHLLWVFGHPEVYVLILPALGLVAIVLSLAGAPLMGPIGFVASSLGIAFIGLVVWAHHMYTTGLNTDRIAYFSAATYTVAIPSGIKVFHVLTSSNLR